MTTQLILIRHAAPEVPRPGAFTGSRDVPLSERGRKQLPSLQARLARLTPEALYVSPMRRAVETLEGAHPSGAASAHVLHESREVDFGRWEGMTFEEIQEKEPELVSRWASGDPSFAFPEGEALPDFRARITRVAAILASDPHETVAVVTHGGVIRTLLTEFLGLPDDRYVVFDIPPACICALNLYDGGGVLTALTPPGEQD